MKKVEKNCNWFDNFCTTYDEEVNIMEGRFRCTTCKHNIPFLDKRFVKMLRFFYESHHISVQFVSANPDYICILLRFRLCTICSDNTGIIVMVFPNDEIQRILGKNVFDVENDDEQVFYNYKVD